MVSILFSKAVSAAFCRLWRFIFSMLYSGLAVLKIIARVCFISLHFCTTLHISPKAGLHTAVSLVSVLNISSLTGRGFPYLAAG